MANATPFFQYGIGEVFLVPSGGNLALNPTPQQGFTIQDVTFEISRKNVKLMGQNQWPDDVAPGDMEGKGELSVGALDIEMFNQVMFSEQASPTTGISIIQPNENQQVPPNPGPYTVTVANAGVGGANFVEDLGVVYATTSGTGQRRQKLERKTGVFFGLTAGQYTVSAGTYTFAAADATASLAISYAYSSPSPGETLLVTSHLQGYGPVVEMWLRQPYQGTRGMHIFAARLTGINAPLKRDNYQISKIGFEFFPTQDIPPKVIEFFTI